MNVANRILQSCILRKVERRSQEQKQLAFQAYQIGCRGERHPIFPSVGEDSEIKDIKSAIGVLIIDHDHEASPDTIRSAERLLIPVLLTYIAGLKDGRKKHGHPQLFDTGRQFMRKIEWQQANSTPDSEK